MSSQRPYSDAFFAHDGHAIDKWAQYLPVYDAILAHLIARGRPVDVLEIGVQNGGMLQLLAKLLPAGSSFVGIDVAPSCRDIAFAGDVRIVIGDATDPAVLAEAAGARAFDLVIDDGSHRSRDVIASFAALIGRVKPGGTYIVEDTHCSYWADYGGGLRNPASSVEHFKTLVDALHGDHLRRDAEPAGDLARIDALRGLAAQISFIDSMIIVRRPDAAETARHKRVFSGAAATVADPLDYFVSRASPDDLSNAAFMPAAAARMAEAYGAARTRIAALERERDQLAREIATLRQKPPSALRAGFRALRRVFSPRRHRARSGPAEP